MKKYSLDFAVENTLTGIITEGTVSLEYRGDVPSDFDSTPYIEDEALKMGAKKPFEIIGRSRLY